MFLLGFSVAFIGCLVMSVILGQALRIADLRDQQRQDNDLWVERARRGEL